MPAKKLVCDDCGTIFNRKPKNKNRQVCWNCGSYKVGPVTGTVPSPSVVIVLEEEPQAPEPQGPVIPTAPDISGYNPPVFTGSGGGGLTPAMLQQAKLKLKKVVRPPIVLPGAPVRGCAIPRGVRTLAFLVKNPIIQLGTVGLQMIWRARGSQQDNYAYWRKGSIDVSAALADIARGVMNYDHSNYNESYQNNSTALPYRRGTRTTPRRLLKGISYFEYGWKRMVPGNTQWHYWSNGAWHTHNRGGNGDVNGYVRNVKHGQIFSERIVIAETGEIFYTPDHYGVFFRYHPGTTTWFQYESAAGARGPMWDESFYEMPMGTGR